VPQHHHAPEGSSARQRPAEIEAARRQYVRQGTRHHPTAPATEDALEGERFATARSDRRGWLRDLPPRRQPAEGDPPAPPAEVRAA